MKLGRLIFAFLMSAQIALADVYIPSSKMYGHELNGLGTIFTGPLNLPSPPRIGERVIVYDDKLKFTAEVTDLIFVNGGYEIKFKDAKLEIKKEVYNFEEGLEIEVPRPQGQTNETVTNKNLSTESFFSVNDFLEAGKNSLAQGAMAGLSVLLYQGLIYDSDTRKSFQEFDARKKQFALDSERISTEINAELMKGFSAYEQSLFQIDLMRSGFALKSSGFDFSKSRTPYQFKSTDPDFVKGLNDIRNAVDSVPKFDSRSLNLKEAAHEFTEMADESHAAGDFDDAKVYQKYALASADLLFGIDPYTGTFRSVYEGFTGRNFVTGAELSTFERGFAIAGMVTFGYGNKIGQGIKGLGKLAGKVLNKRNIEAATSVASAALNRAKSSVLYRRHQLWRTESALQKSHPELLSKIQAKPDSSKYLKNIQDRGGLGIPNPYDPSIKIPQEMSIEALDAIERVEKSGNLVARQGQFGISEAQRQALKAGDLPEAEIDRLMKGSNIIATSPVDKQSIYFGEVVADLGTPAYGNRHGIYSKTVDFVEVVEIEKGTSFLTRTAPGGRYVDPLNGQIHKTAGGAIEVLVPQGKAQTKEFWIFLEKNKTLKIKVQP